MAICGLAPVWYKVRAVLLTLACTTRGIRRRPSAGRPVSGVGTTPNGRARPPLSIGRERPAGTAARVGRGSWVVLTPGRPARIEGTGRYLSFVAVAMLVFGVLAAPVSAAPAPPAPAAAVHDTSAQKSVPAVAAQEALGTPETVIDDGGPDDVPGQKDLSFMTVTYLG